MDTAAGRDVTQIWAATRSRSSARCQATTLGYTQQSPVSLVAYRVNEATNSGDRYGRLERMAKGSYWNALDNNPNSNAPSPIVFSAAVKFRRNWSLVGPWSAASTTTTAPTAVDNDYEVIGPDVFRFEYYYLLKNGRVTDWPWDRFDFPDQLTIYNPLQLGLSQVEAIAVTIAVIDSAGRALIQAASSMRAMEIFLMWLQSCRTSRIPVAGGSERRTLGDLEDQWKGVIESFASDRPPSKFKLLFPREAAKGIRVYSRYFDLKTL